MISIFAGREKTSAATIPPPTTTGGAAPPHTLRDCPEYLAAAAKLASLRSDLRELQNHIEELRLRAAKYARTQDQNALLSEATERLMAGETVAPLADPRELEALEVKRLALQRAIELQKSILQSEKSRASRIICEALRPEHREISRDLINAVIALGHSVHREIRFREELARTGADAIGLPAMPFDQVGDPVDPGSPIRIFLRSAVELGVITRAEIPDWTLRSARTRQ